MLVSKILFYTLIFLLPVNLGKHFDVKEAFVDGFLVDYLQPVLFIQDILIASLLVFWLFEVVTKKVKLNLNKKHIQIYLLFVFSIFLSVLNSNYFLVSFYSFARYILYSFMFLYGVSTLTVEKDFEKIVKLISVSTLFLCVLGIIQFVKQGALFNNYLILGEQPYSSTSWQVIREKFLHYVFIPPYSLFRHPNIFGGFLSIVLLWIYYFRKKHTWFNYVFYLGLINLLLTFSMFSWVSFGIGFLFSAILQKSAEKIRLYKLFFSLLTLVIVAFVFFIPFIDNKITYFNETPSLFRRSGLLGISYYLIKNNFLFGVGWNSSIFYTLPLISKMYGFYFAQPVHNIFVLTFVESGVFSFLLLLSIFFLSIKKQLNSGRFCLFLVSVLQIMFLGSFDHYFLTIHQPAILMWLTISLSFL